jgi:predicted RNase H-like nuclease (RuvC/YqgF family)
VKKPVLISLFAVVVLGMAAWVYTLSREKQMVEGQYVSAVATGDSLRTNFDLALSSIAEIQDSLTAILPTESQVMTMSEDVERSPLTASRKDQVLRSISDLQGSIERSKEMIRALEQRLEERDVQVANLERVITGLKRTVADREQMIASLNERVGSLEVEVVGLKEDVAEGQATIRTQEQTIEEKRREISTVYYVVDSNKNLKEAGVVKNSGGVIGIGKTPKLTGEFPRQVFDPIDTDTSRTILIAGDDPKVLSGQSATSYQIVPVAEDRSELRITNPEEFRKVRYLVIQVG